MSMRVLSVPLLVAATLVASGGAVGAGTSASLRYHGGIPSGMVEMTPHSGPTYGAPTWMNAGGGWFAVPSAARSSLDAKVVDDSGRVVAADVRFLIQQYEPLAAGPRFCGSASGIGIPTGSQALYVRVLTAESVRCMPPGVPTAGVISVTFRN
ncbi:MAG: hypothetical protein ACRDKJ_13365 [Actinomycetota bacterium]